MAKRADSNQPEFVAALRKMGISWCGTHVVGHGCPDGFAAYQGNTVAVEIKRGEKEKLTKAEKEFQTQWQGIYLVTCDPVMVAKALGRVK